MNKSLKIFSLFFLMMLSGFYAKSQPYPVKVQVQLVQPFYPYLSDYKQKSVISFTNTTDVPMDIYLQAKLENDRGQMIKTAPNQYSRIPIHLPGMQTVVVQGFQLDTSFFDLHNLQTNLDQQTKAKLYQLGMIPEGFYTYCVTAFFIDGNGAYQPVSDPQGSCAFVNVGYVQPPQILSPLPDDHVVPNPTQNVSITWTRPVGNLQGAALTYNLYLVKVLKGQDPQLAMSNAVQYGAGIFLKQENIPSTFYRFTNLSNFQLENGSEYALMVQSRDMNGNAAFVNDGRSEVSVFTYGQEAVAESKNHGVNNQNKTGRDIDVVKGRLQWAFKTSEEGTVFQYTYTPRKNLIIPPPPPQKSQPSPGGTIQRLVMSKATIVAKPFYNFIPNFVVSADPTTVSLSENKKQSTPSKLNLKNVSVSKTNVSKAALNKVERTIDYAQFVQAFSATAADSTHSENKSIATDTASQRYSLTGVNVTLRGIPANDPDKKVLLGTGVTGDDGRFTINFLDPDFQNSGAFSKLILSAQADDFENTVFEIPVPNGNVPGQLDLGTKVLLARTWRYFPKITYEKSDATDVGESEVHIYRDVSDYKSRPWLMEEGRTTGKERKQEVIDGKKVFEIASLKVEQQTSLRRMAQVAIGRNSGEGVGRLFYGGKLLVKITPSSNSYHPVTSNVTAFNKSLSSTQVMAGEAIYQLDALPPHVEGNVSLFMSGPSIQISGAIVRVMYHKADVVEEPKTILDILGNTKVTKAANYGNYSGMQLTQDHLQKANKSVVGKTPAMMLVSNKINSTENNASGNYSVKPVVSEEEEIKPAPVCQGCSYKLGYTDDVGHYYIGNLPVLKPEASFTVEVVKLPSDFRKFEISNKGGGDYPAIVKIGKGVSAQQDFSLNAEVMDVGGRIVDKEGKGLSGVRLVFKGNTLTTSGMDGLFIFKLYPGSHAITLKKEGYIQKEISINIPDQKNENKQAGSNNSKWAGLNVSQKHQATLNRIKNIPTVQSAISAGYKFSPSMFGLPEKTSTQSAISTTSYNESIVAAFGILTINSITTKYEVPRSSALDVRDVGYLEKISGKIQFVIKDKETNKPVANAQIKIFDTTHVTDGEGKWYYEGFGGATVVTIKPPQSSGYVAEQKSLTLPENGQVQNVTILLEKGIKISGLVTSGGSPLSRASVFADFGDLIETTTDNLGHYELYVKKGKHDLSARLQNYVGKDLDQKSIPTDGTVFNFDLQGGNGKNYGKLLGFDIELSKAERSGSEEIWSGNFIHVQPEDPSVFIIAKNVKIPFTNVKVRFDGSGNPHPVSNKVETDITNIPVKLYGYLPAVFENSNVVTITDAGGNKGQLKGKVSVSFNAIQGYRGWKIPGDVKVMIAKSGTSSGDFVFMQAGSAASPVNDSWTLITANGKPLDAQLYGFKIHLNSNASISEKGFEFSGSISTPALSVIKSVNIGIKNFSINRSLAISGVQIETNDLPSLNIAGWQAGFTSLIFNEDGFKIGGKLAINIPSSGKSEIDFSELAIARDEIYGGKFLIPGKGINLLSVANLNTGGEPLVFGRVGNSTVYRIGGKANLKINLSLFSKEFKIPTFEVLTNGTFNLQAPVGYSTSLGPFGFSIQNIYINTTAGTPFIGIQGGFKTDIDFLKFEVADIKVTASSGGPKFHIEKVGVALDVPVVKISASVAFKDNGFEGTGSLSIPATPIVGSVSFRYFKNGSSIDLGAHFSANIPPIPIGAIVTLERVGGGFDYTDGNLSVDINGKLSLLGTGAVVGLDPVGLTVSTRGILKGYGDVTISDYLKTAHAETIFNGLESSFTVQISAQMSPLEGLLKQEVKGALVISAKPNDEYAFLGCSVLVNIAGLVDAHGEMALAVGLKNPKNHDPITAHYFQYAPEEYMQDVFTGVYINVAAQLGVPRERAIGFDITIASAKIWCSSAFQASLILNFAEDAYRIKFGGKFDAGFEACVAEIACVSLSAGLCYVVEGGRNDVDGWNFSATATGNVSCSFGIGLGDCDPGCNEVVTVWDGCIGGAFKICAGAGLDFGYSERQGLNFNIHGADHVVPCF